MLWRLVILLFVVARPAAGYFNLFLSYAEVRKLLGKVFSSVEGAAEEARAGGRGSPVIVPLNEDPVDLTR